MLRSDPLAPLVLLIAAIGLVCSGDFAWAQSGKTTSSKKETETKEEKFFNRGTTGDADGYSVFYRGGAGGLWEQQTEVSKTGPANKDGYQLWAEAVISRYSKDSVWDLGLGWSFSAIEGDEPLPLTGVQSNVTIRTQSALIDLAWRKRLTKSLELGPVIGLLGGGNLNYNSEATSQRVAGIIGVQLFYHDYNPTFSRRVGGQLWTDLGVAKRTMIWVGLSLDIGFALAAYDRDVTERSTIDRNVITDRTVIETQQDREVDILVVKVPVKEGKLVFNEGQTTLDAASEQTLQRLAEGMLGIQGAWRRIVVQVRQTTNGSLADARGKAVAQALVARGLPAARVKGRGATGIDQTGRKLRIELHFLGATDEAAIRREVAAALGQLGLPETCTDEGCK